MQHEVQGLFIQPDGAVRPAGIKGGLLYDLFHGIRRHSDRNLSAGREDLGRAYAGVVWAYRCVKLRADAVAGVPLVLEDRHGSQIADHPLLTLLRDVNPYTMNLGDLLRATEAAYNIWGVAYWLKVRRTGSLNGNGRTGSSPAPTGSVKWIEWLNPTTIEPVIIDGRGIVAYKQTVGKVTREFPAEDVIVFRNFDPADDLGGLSPLSVALHEVNAELNASRYVAAFFSNEARPAGLLSTDQTLVDAEMDRVTRWWEKMFRGVGNRWKTGIVGGGLRWQTISYPPRDLALRELREEDRMAICAVFGVPPGMAGAWESTTYATAREQKASFYEDTILPQLEYLAEVLNWSLLPHYPDLVALGARITWDTDSITALRESASDKALRLTRLFEAGVIRRNEVRAGLGLPPVPADEDGYVWESGESEDDDPGPDPTIPAGAMRHPLPNLPALEAKGFPLETVRVRPSLLDEIGRWERFALARKRQGKSLRPFKTSAIPMAIWEPLTREIEGAESVSEVKAVFAALKERMEANQLISRSANQPVSRAA